MTSNDSREIFERMASVETGLKNLNTTVNTLVVNQNNHMLKMMDKVSKNSVNIEKSKLSTILSTISIAVSACTVIGLVIILLKSQGS